MLDNVKGKAFNVSFREDVPCIYIQWFGLPTSEEFKLGCNSALDLLIEKKVSKVLTDNSKAKVFSKTDLLWLNEDWLPRAEKAGYKYSAVVYSSSETFVKFAVDNIVKGRDSNKFISQRFQCIEDALYWLKTV